MSGQTSYGQNDGSAFIDGFNSVGVVHNDAQGYLSTSKIVAEDISANAITSDKLANDISYNGLFKVNNIDNVSVDSQVANKKYVDDQITEIRGGVPQVTVDTLKELSEKLVDASGTEIFARLANPTFTGTVSGITKSMVGLGNVDNTSDASKPVSTSQQTALDLKATLASPTFTGTVGGITKSMVGLGNVDNTTDASKPVSTAQQTALNLKAPLANPTFTGTVSGITKSMVGLSNVDNTSDASKPVSTSQQTALDLKATLASPTFTGTVSGITKSMVGLGNVDNTSDASKPVSTAQQTALDLKAPLASPTFTGTVGGITKSMVSLSNVDNTSDASKPVSTAQQTALDLKASLVSPTFTGTVTISDNITVSDFSTGVLHSDASGNLSSSLIVAADITNSAIVSDKISSNAVSSDKLAVDISYNGILKVVDCSGGSVNQVANKGYVDSKIIDSYSTISKILVSTTPPSNPDVGAIYIAPTGSNIYSEGIIIAENIPFPWLRVCALNSSGVKIWHSLTTYDDARPL